MKLFPVIKDSDLDLLPSALEIPGPRAYHISILVTVGQTVPEVLPGQAFNMKKT